MGRRKYLGRANGYIKSFTSKIVRVDDGDLNGYAARTVINEVNRPLIIEENDAAICLYDSGHSEINFLPDNENWQFYAIYDKHGKIIEYYFDITSKNAVDEEGNPYCDDLYLDIVLRPDGRIMILDEDELREARENGDVTADEFHMAYRVKDELIGKKIIDADYMEAVCARLRAILQA